MEDLVIAVDVGTGSARAGIYDGSGRLHGRGEAPIRLIRSGATIAQYSSDDIWAAVAHAVRHALSAGAVNPEHIRGIGFDATCSLVVRRADGTPLPVHDHQDLSGDTIAWLDHRAIAESAELSAIESEALQHSGGMFSPEMQLPKLLWLKRHLPETWAQAGRMADLADDLVWRATGTDRRAWSTLATKWGWLPGGNPDTHLLKAAGLDDLPARAGIAGEPGRVGELAGRLSKTAAADLGLPAGIAVPFGMVDAYAGALSALGLDDDTPGQVILIGGTSACLMWMTDKPVFARSFWGPFGDALLAGRHVTEGGLSAAGALLDHIVTGHPAGSRPGVERHQSILADIEIRLAQDGHGFAKGVHILPDFHGNRTPIGSPLASGIMTGLDLDQSHDSLIRIYYRAMVAIALGLRQIIESGAPELAAGTIHLAGGHARHPLFSALYADATGLPVAVSAGDEGMLLGNAIMTAVAAGLHGDLAAAARAMQRPATYVSPDPARKTQLDHDYGIFRKLQEFRDIIK